MSLVFTTFDNQFFFVFLFFIEGFWVLGKCAAGKRELSRLLLRPYVGVHGLSVGLVGLRF